MTERVLVRGAEAALAALTVAAVLGMSRLFAGTRWIGPLVVAAVAAHALAAVLRRRHVPLGLAALLMALGAVLVTSWTTYWSTTLVGLPTADTFSSARGDLDAAWALYQHAVAPTPAVDGYLVAAAIAIWAVAFVADWAAFRLWVPFEATLPVGTLFLFTALLGADAGRAWGIAIYAAALLAFLLLHRLARQDGTGHWVTERRASGNRSLVVAGAGLAALAVAAGALIGPSLPGADASGILDPQDLHHNDPRVTISPLVDIQSRLVDQSNVEVFTVHSDQRAYWRLTSLERFDGRIWSSSGSYGKAGRHLPQAEATKVAAQPVDQTYSISALAQIWLPSAYRPTSFDSKDADVRYDESSSTLIVDSKVPTSDGLTYSVTSESPRLTPRDLQGTAGEVPRGIRSTYTELPGDFPARVTDLARQITAGDRSPFARARALQDYLRTYTYDLTVPPGHSDDALERFLFVTKRGYCEQFAGAYAAMARAIGLPARVAVGFTPGEQDPSDPTLFHVLGEHAHAWPEVYFAGAGWVAFEPTPGRGMPNAESYTGVPEQQAATGNPTTATTLAPTAPSQSAGAPSTTLQPDQGTQGSSSSDGGGGEDTSILHRFGERPARRAVPLLLLLLVLYGGGVPAALAAHRRRRRRRATTPAQRVALAWVEAAEDAALVGYQTRASDTSAEQADRLTEVVPGAGAAAGVLARARETADYSPDGADEQTATAATSAAAAIHTAVMAAAPLGAKARRWLDPRPDLRAWREARRRTQRQITTIDLAEGDADRELVGAGAPDLG
jgi:transglutaminase-like putative cysteine protease